MSDTSKTRGRPAAGNAKRNERVRVRKLHAHGDNVAASIAVVRYLIGIGDMPGVAARCRVLANEVVALEREAAELATARVSLGRSMGVVSLVDAARMAGVVRQAAYNAYAAGKLGPAMGRTRSGSILVHVSTAAPWILACRASKA